MQKRSLCCIFVNIMLNAVACLSHVDLLSLSLSLSHSLMSHVLTSGLWTLLWWWRGIVVVYLGVLRLLWWRACAWRDMRKARKEASHRYSLSIIKRRRKGVIYLPFFYRQSLYGKGRKWKKISLLVSSLSQASPLLKINQWINVVLYFCLLYLPLHGISTFLLVPSSGMNNLTCLSSGPAVRLCLPLCLVWIILPGKEDGNGRRRAALLSPSSACLLQPHRKKRREEGRRR